MGREFPLVYLFTAQPHNHPLPVCLPSCAGALEQLQEELQAKQRSTEWQEQELRDYKDHKLAQVEEAA